jgi:hypothetical protein
MYHLNMVQSVLRWYIGQCELRSLNMMQRVLRWYIGQCILSFLTDIAQCTNWGRFAPYLNFLAHIAQCIIWGRFAPYLKLLSSHCPMYHLRTLCINTYNLQFIVTIYPLIFFNIFVYRGYSLGSLNRRLWLLLFTNDYNLKRTKHTCSEPNLLKHLYHKREFKATNTPVWWHSSSDVDGHEWMAIPSVASIDAFDYFCSQMTACAQCHNY